MRHASRVARHTSPRDSPPLPPHIKLLATSDRQTSSIVGSSSQSTTTTTTSTPYLPRRASPLQHTCRWRAIRTHHAPRTTHTAHYGREALPAAERHWVCVGRRCASRPRNRRLAPPFTAVDACAQAHAAAALALCSLCTRRRKHHARRRPQPRVASAPRRWQGGHHCRHKRPRRRGCGCGCGPGPRTRHNGRPRVYAGPTTPWACCRARWGRSSSRGA